MGGRRGGAGVVPRRLRIGEAQLASPSQAPKAPSLLRRCVLFEPNRVLGPLPLAKLAIALSQATDAAGWCLGVCAARPPKKKMSTVLTGGLKVPHTTTRALQLHCNPTALHCTSQLQLSPRCPGSPHATHTHTRFLSPCSSAQSVIPSQYHLC